MNNSTISYVGKKVSIGLDVHRDFFVASAVSGGELLKRCRMPSQGESVLSFIGKHFRGSEVRTCYEAGYSGFWLHRFLRGNGIDNIVVHAASVEVEAGNRVKTDKRDSLKLAEQLDCNRLRGIYVPSEEQEQRRLLTRTREQLIRARSRVRMQIRMKLHQFGLFPAEYRKAISEQLVEKILTGGLAVELDTTVRVLLRQWRELNKDLKVLECKLKEQALCDPYEAVYRSAPGIGVLIARVLSNELGDMSQFPNERALFSYTGLTPGEHSSGNHIRRGHISRQCGIQHGD